MKFMVSIAVGLALALSTAGQSSNTTLPTVDLGYLIQRATSINTTGQYYNFSNIRYAAPAVGNLRFAAPATPTTNRSAVQDGSQGRICPQATPAWEATAARFLEGLPLNSSSSSSLSIPAADPRETEDCLFLDVIVPKGIFDSVNATNSSSAPVLVWIYGGGYTMGDKAGSGNPAGLIRKSENGSSPGIIFVAMNYRLGAFGWLSGPTLQANGTANAGLLDQRFALQWVQQYIHLFGGNASRVTVVGESAGGGSIMHQITAYGGLGGPAPFSQAVLQSPGFLPIPSNYEQETVTQGMLTLLNVSTIQALRQLPYSALRIANLAIVGASSYGTYTFGPVVDGSFAPAPPGKLLLQGAYHKNLTLMLGHNANEGLLFTNPYITNNSTFNTYLSGTFPGAQPPVTNIINGTLYPPIFNGSYGYTSETGRVDLLISESVFTCNTVFLDRAFGNRTYAYLFAVPPAIHGSDVPYTFYNGPSASVVNATVAQALQEYILSFAETGAPEAYTGIPHFNMYGNQSMVLELNVTGIMDVMDPAANQRCSWWQKALYY